MPRLTPLSEAKADALAELHNQTYPAKYRVSGNLIDQQIIRSPLLLDDSLAAWEGKTLIGALALKRPAKGHLWRGEPRHTIHAALIAGSREAISGLLREAPSGDLHFGSDHDHLLHGVPPEVFDLFRDWEFGEETVDMEGDLAGYQAPQGSLYPLETHGCEVRTATHDDRHELDRFLAREFAGRWRHDTMRKVLIDGEPQEIDLLLNQEGEVIGFSFTQSPASTRPIGGAVFHEDLGDNWRGLGPIGISMTARGKGLGNALLAASLQRLKDSGGRRCIIDWTTLDDWYGMHGFGVARRYRAARLARD